MDVAVEITLLGQASALPGREIPLTGDLEHLGRARLLPPTVRGSDRLLQRVVGEARSRQRDTESFAPLYLASRSPAEAGGAEEIHIGSAVAGLHCATGALRAVEDGERPMLVGIGLLDATVPLVDGPIPLAEAAAAAWLAPANDRAPGPRRHLVMGSASAPTREQDFAELLGTITADAGTTPASIREVISATDTMDALSLEAAALNALLPRAELLQLAWRVGSAGPALGVLALLAAIEDGEGVIVLASDKNRCRLACVL